MSETPWEHGSAKHKWRVGEGAIPAQYGEWIEHMARWSWFVTRTYSPENLTDGFTQAGKAICDTMLLDLLRRSVAKQVVAVYERQERGDYHLHALLARCRAINGRVEQERDKELYGISRWKVFRGTGAGAYLAKYLSKDRTALFIGQDGPYDSLHGLEV